MGKEDIKEFAIEFFKNLGSKVINREDSVLVKDVPYAFENFAGKSAPYTLVFDTNKHNEIENSELLVRGSYLLKTMRDYLQDKAQTTLLKLNIEIQDPSKEIKKDLKFMNCRLIEVNKKKKNSYMSKFIFLSTCQYLNEKEQFINSVIVGNNRIFDVNLENYNVIEGNVNDVGNMGIENDYNIAIGQLKEIFSKKTQSIQQRLHEKLSRELSRVKHHYKNQQGENDEDLETSMEKLEIAKNQLDRAYYDDEKRKLRKRVDRLKKHIQSLKEDDYKSRLNREREFFIQDEIFKHSINLSNKLINASVIYYPNYSFTLNLKKAQISKDLELNYNPILKKIDVPICEDCKKETKEINLCTNNHVVCIKCLGKCSSCNKEFCSKCLSFSCSKCGKKLCKDCSVKCPNCNKYYCKDHIKTCPICKKDVCVDCLVKCSDCGKLICKDHLKKCQTCSREICEPCAKKDFIKCSKCSKTICSKCVQKCKICKKEICKDHSNKCSGCGAIVCNEHIEKCPICKKQFCHKCLMKCEGCGKRFCKDSMEQCKKCNSIICERCVRWGKVLGISILRRCVKCEAK